MGRNSVSAHNLNIEKAPAVIFDITRDQENIVDGSVVGDVILWNGGITIRDHVLLLIQGKEKACFLWLRDCILTKKSTSNLYRMKTRPNNVIK